jgi:hypothetical protein
MCDKNKYLLTDDLTSFTSENIVRINTNESWMLKNLYFGESNLISQEKVKIGYFYNYLRLHNFALKKNLFLLKKKIFSCRILSIILS